MTRTTTASSVRAGRSPARTSRRNAEVRLAVVGVVERRVDLPRVEAEEPRPQPVVVAVLHDPQVRRRGHDEAGAIGQAAGPQRGLRPRRHVAGVAQQRDPGRGGRGLAVEPTELALEAVEDVALRRAERRPGREVADVARGHAERVRHDLGQVRRTLAVEDAGQGGGQEAVGRPVEVEARPDEQELGERPAVERDRDLGRDRLDAGRWRPSRSLHAGRASPDRRGRGRRAPTTRPTRRPRRDGGRRGAFVPRRASPARPSRR